mgnify:CR=1 FL=1
MYKRQLITTSITSALDCELAAFNVGATFENTLFISNKVKEEEPKYKGNLRASASFLVKKSSSSDDASSSSSSFRFGDDDVVDDASVVNLLCKSFCRFFSNGVTFSADGEVESSRRRLVSAGVVSTYGVLVVANIYTK